MSLAMSSTLSISSARHRLRMREIETQPVGRNQRALLRDVIAQHLAQRLVQQMRGRVVLPDVRRGARDRPSSNSWIADLDRPLLHL